MSDTVGQLVTLVAAGTSSGSNLLQAKRALSSVTGHLAISNANHMGDEYPARRTWAHVGFPAFYAGAPSGIYTRPPRVADIDWAAPLTGRTANAISAGSWVVPFGATSTLPRAMLRCRVRCGTKTDSKVGLYFAVTPGVGVFPSDTSRFAATQITSDTLGDVELELALSQEDLAPLVTTPSTGSVTNGVPPLASPVRLMVCSFWFGANNVWNDSDPTEVGDVFGVTVGLEP